MFALCPSLQQAVKESVQEARALCLFCLFYLPVHLQPLFFVCLASRFMISVPPRMLASVFFFPDRLVALSLPLRDKPLVPHDALCRLAPLLCLDNIQTSQDTQDEQSLLLRAFATFCFWETNIFPTFKILTKYCSCANFSLRLLGPGGTNSQLCGKDDEHTNYSNRRLELLCENLSRVSRDLSGSTDTRAKENNHGRCSTAMLSRFLGARDFLDLRTVCDEYNFPISATFVSSTNLVWPLPQPL